MKSNRFLRKNMLDFILSASYSNPLEINLLIRFEFLATETSQLKFQKQGKISRKQILSH